MADQIDANGDGSITKPEFMTHFENVLKNKSEKKCSQMLVAFLAVAMAFRENSEAAQLTVEVPVSTQMERDKRVLQLFNILDSHGYGMIEVSALQQFSATESDQIFGSFEKMAAKIDTNGDGHINKAEFVRFFEAKLPQSDAEFNPLIERFSKLARESHEQATREKLKKQQALTRDGSTASTLH